MTILLYTMRLKVKIFLSSSKIVKIQTVNERLFLYVDPSIIL